jgi:antitoxin ParD1/3/4
MVTETLTITLNEPLKTFVLEQAAAAGYPQPADYVSALIDAERRRKAQSELESLLVEGIESGPSVEADKDYWTESRRKLGLPPRR